MKLQRIGPADYPRFEIYFKGQRYPHSAYALASILVWANEIYEPYAAVVDGWFTAGYEFPALKIHRHLLLPVSPDKEASPEDLVRIARRLGFDAYALVPEEYLQRQGRARVESLFEVAPLDGHADYIYRAEDLAALDGRRYSKKRNLIRQFERDFVSRGRVAVEKITPGVSGECGAFLDEWCVENGCGEEGREELRREKIAAQNAIMSIDDIGLTGILVRVDGRIAGFGIGSPLTSEMGVLLFEKALVGHRGLYQFLDRECARRLFVSFSLINKEGDLGEAGLAKSKRSYFPVQRMKSYRLNLRA